MYPNSIYFGLKVVPIREIWSQSIYFLGTWTLRVRLRTYVVSRGLPVLSANATNCTMKSAENVLVDADLAILDKPRRRVRGFGVQYRIWASEGRGLSDDKADWKGVAIGHRDSHPKP